MNDRNWSIRAAAHRLLGRLGKDTRAATAIEYALVCGLISIAAVTAMSGISDQLQTTFNTTSSTFANP